jgi:hypothetical protein
MDIRRMEEIYTETFSGLTFFYRDTNLAEDLISKYHIGQIIMERGFTDMSYKGGGLQSNFRYLIASAYAKDLSGLNPSVKKYGFVILNRDAYFKVLDIYKVGDKTQVFLLNIPEHAVDLFKISTTNIEKDITEKARKSFDEKLGLEPIKELQSDYWTERTEFPIGMSDEGKLFYDDQGKPATNIFPDIDYN